MFAVVATKSDASDEAADAAWRAASLDLPPVSDRTLLERAQASMPGPDHKKKPQRKPLAAVSAVASGFAAARGVALRGNQPEPPAESQTAGNGAGGDCSAGRGRGSGRRPGGRSGHLHGPGPGGGVNPVDRATLEARLRDEGLEPSSWSNEPGYRYQSHAHDYDKVLVAVEGSVTFGLVGYSTGLRPGRRRAAGSACPRRTRRRRGTAGRGLSGSPFAGRHARKHGPGTGPSLVDGGRGRAERPPGATAVASARARFCRIPRR